MYLTTAVFPVPVFPKMRTLLGRSPLRAGTRTCASCPMCASRCGSRSGMYDGRRISRSILKIARFPRYGWKMLSSMTRSPERREPPARSRPFDAKSDRRGRPYQACPTKRFPAGPTRFPLGIAVRFLFSSNNDSHALLQLESYTSTRHEMHHTGKPRDTARTSPNPPTIDRVTKRDRVRCWSSGMRSAADTNRNMPAENASPTGTNAAPTPANAAPTRIPRGVSIAVARMKPIAPRRDRVDDRPTAGAAKLSGTWWRAIAMRITVPTAGPISNPRGITKPSTRPWIMRALRARVPNGWIVWPSASWAWACPVECARPRSSRSTTRRTRNPAATPKATNSVPRPSSAAASKLSGRRSRNERPKRIPAERPSMRWIVRSEICVRREGTEARTRGVPPVRRAQKASCPRSVTGRRTRGVLFKNSWVLNKTQGSGRPLFATHGDRELQPGRRDPGAPRRRGGVRALRDFIDAAEWSGEGGRASVILAVPYERASPRGDRAALQHRFGEVRTMLHTHLDERTCLQIFVAEGATARLKEFVARIRRVKGVRHIRFIQSAAE